jgi:hypothetical protein
LTKKNRKKQVEINHKSEALWCTLLLTVGQPLLDNNARQLGLFLDQLAVWARAFSDWIIRKVAAKFDGTLVRLLGRKTSCLCCG